MAYHLWSTTQHWSFDPGSTGVVGFFALSGYLITGLLIGEHTRNGRVGLANFYARRALRLVPALLLLLAVWLAVVLLFPQGRFLTTVPSSNGPGGPVSWITGLQAVGAALLYVTNWLDVEPHWHLFYGYSPISHLWTLAVEEQFYVLWAPAMVLLLRLRRHAATLIAAAIAVFFLLDPVLLSASGFNRVYFGTDSRCGALFCGAVCAFIASRGAWARLRRAPWAPALGAILLASIGWSTWALGQESHRGVWNTGLIVASLACALSVVYVVERPDGAAGRFLTRRMLVGIGRRSYALYLWSYVLNTWLRDTGFLESYLVIGASFLAAEISYRLVELPALRLKERFAAPPPTPDTVPPSGPPMEPVGVR